MLERRNTFGVIHLVIAFITIILFVIRDCFQCSQTKYLIRFVLRKKLFQKICIQIKEKHILACPPHLSKTLTDFDITKESKVK
jgi:uncharacterized membrane protein SirB2